MKVVIMLDGVEIVVSVEFSHEEGSDIVYIQIYREHDDL
jgi:hypothetical protein